MTPKKIVVINDFKETKGEPMYYDIAQHLTHGFIAAGHFTARFSDRDVARALGFGSKSLGVPAMKKRLRQLIATVKPDMALFGHADLFSAQDFEDLRNTHPGIRLAQINIDSPYRTETMRKFAARTRSVDVSFFTAADLGPSAGMFAPGHPIFFTPPMVCPAIEPGRADHIPRSAAPRDMAFLGSVCVDRPAQIAELTRRLPSSARFEVHGKVNGTPSISGAAFVDYLGQTPMSPSLQPDSSVGEAPLYMSTRVAQLLGNGVVGFAHRSTGLDALYEDGIRLYDAISDLAEDAAALMEDDARRRAIGATGWRLAHERTAASAVCQYMLDITLEAPARPAWPMAEDIAPKT